MNLATWKGHPTDGGWPSHRAGGLVLLLIGAVLADLITDRWACAGEARQLFAKGLATLLALAGALWLYLLLRSRTRIIRALTRDLGKVQEEARHWREESAAWARGLAEAIDEQFSRWGLSPAEREVALLLLKGLSTPDIAAMRATREATVRQQAQGVYRKAGLEGRADLAAFFLEDLLAPRTSAGRG